MAVVGQPAELLKDDQRWEDRVVEAPTMVKSPSGYELFFSGGFFGWNPDEGGLSPYAMGYASCTGPLGPCTAAKDNPILHSFSEREAGCLSGPGHQSIFKVGARTFMSFHAWQATSSCRKRGRPPLSLHRADLLEGRQAADRAEPALGDTGSRRRRPAQ